MSGLAAPPAAEDGSIWIEELVERNAELLSAIAENQGLGRLADAVMYQELFQENVLRLCQFCDLSNEALSADATLGGLLDGPAARARDPPRPSGDEVAGPTGSASPGSGSVTRFAGAGRAVFCARSARARSSGVVGSVDSPAVAK